MRSIDTQGRRSAGLRPLASLALFCVAAACGSAPPPKKPVGAVEARVASRLPTIAAKTTGLAHHEGLLDLYSDAAEGRVYLVVPAPSGSRGRVGEYLYVEGIETGLGSNPVGLDRGQQGEAQVVEMRRIGGRLLFEVENLRFRALSKDAAESEAVRQSFATSILWAGPVVAEDPSGRALVDFTSFLLRDAHGVGARLAATHQGAYTLDRDRSTIDFDACLAFPDNLELVSIETFTGSSPGDQVLETAPVGEALTFVVHQSLVRLPDGGYRPRAFDPREASFPVAFADYAAPLTQSIEKKWIVRFRVEKQDPRAERAAALKPIVYYVDRAAPEPVRSALVEGVGWWAKAFEAAGFQNGFRVEVLPEGANPLDARYNVVEWVHRATRGWSYGGGVIDPRTGEVVKGHVILGSLRIRQDRLLFEGLLGAAKTGTGAADDPVVLSLARIRQLGAHEVGHTLGFAHNFAASTYGRASVMDYPAPLVDVTEDGRLDASNAYAKGLGEWDVHAVEWAYTQFPPGIDEKKALDEITRDGLARGFVYLSDADARPSGAANPLANLWDNGEDPVDGLTKEMRVREIALARFAEENLPDGEALARLEEVLVPVYFHHRYELQAAAKVLGGLDYRYNVKGDGQLLAKPVSATRQRKALAALLATLSPGVLDLPEELLHKLVPHPPGIEGGERFETRTSPAFDALGAAGTAADLTVRALLDPARAARLVDFHRRYPGLPALEEVLQAIVDRAFADPALLTAREAEVQRVVERVVVDRLIDLGRNRDAAPWVRVRVDSVLADLLQRLDSIEPLDAGEKAHLAGLTATIGRYLARPAEASPEGAAARAAPPGDPIGAPSLSLPAAAGLDDEDCAFARYFEP